VRARGGVANVDAVEFGGLNLFNCLRRRSRVMDDACEAGLIQRKADRETIDIVVIEYENMRFSIVNVVHAELQSGRSFGVRAGGILSILGWSAVSRQVAGCVDQPDMGEGLREVAKHPVRIGIVLLGKESDIIPQA
jgi:hypothetical protein